MKFVVSVVLVLACLALITGALNSGVVVRRGTVSPDKNLWTKSSLSANSGGDSRPPVKLRVQLKQQNLDLLETKVWSVSDPTNPDYGNFLTVSQLRDLIAPPAAHLQEVLEWLQQANPLTVEVVPTGDYVLVELAADAAEQLFGVELVTYERRTVQGGSIQYILRASEQTYTLPADLVHLVDGVSGLVDFPPLVSSRAHSFAMRSENAENMKTSRGGNDEPGINVDPLLIKKLYKIGPTVGRTTNSTQAVASFEQEYFYPSDIVLFQQKFGLPQQNVSTVVGKNHPDSGYLSEASLDLQYIMGVATNVSTWVFYHDIFDLVQWGLNITSTPNAPKVHSISYGSGESYYEADTMNQANTELQKLATLGYSILSSSGDEGTGNTGYFWCETFDANFPASSPFITAVGGTYTNSSTGPEVGWESSGGGFSKIFARPSYQAAVVQQYLQQSGLPSPSYFNASGRGLPDVSALSTNFAVVIQGLWGALSGTSASAPTFSAIVALLNDARAQVGKGPLGFLNPFLYQLGRVGFDVTEGNNQYSPCPAGFPAVVGWDAITGLGTPDFQVLLKAALSV